MHYQYFTIPAIDPEHSTQQLNAFMARHQILSVQEHFVADGQNSYWSIRLTVIEHPDQNPLQDNKSNKRKAIDYREVLTPEIFAVYAKLRSLRNQIAEQQGVPAYAIFINEPDKHNDNIGFRLAGACVAGGSFNQRHVRFCRFDSITGRQIQGLRRVSRLLLNTCRQAALFSMQQLISCQVGNRGLI